MGDGSGHQAWVGREDLGGGGWRRWGGWGGVLCVPRAVSQGGLSVCLQPSG